MGVDALGKKVGNEALAAPVGAPTLKSAAENPAENRCRPVPVASFMVNEMPSLALAEPLMT